MPVFGGRPIGAVPFSSISTIPAPTSGSIQRYLPKRTMREYYFRGWGELVRLSRYTHSRIFAFNSGGSLFSSTRFTSFGW